MQPLTVLSLFDGMSCGRIALERAGIPVETYYSSEIDKYAIQVADNNYPQDSEHRLGNVTTIDATVPNCPIVDLLIGGSPCQGFSFAGKQKGASTSCNIEITTLKQYLNLIDEGFTFNGQSYLFWEYVRLLTETKPKYFFLENVKMTKKWETIISDTLGVQPLRINSALVSAQNRERLYWTNIPNVTIPGDRNICLSDILEPDLPSCGIGGRIVGRRLNTLGKRADYDKSIPIIQYLELRTDSKAGCLTTVYKDSVVPYFKTDKRLSIKFKQNKASCITDGGNFGGNHSDMGILVINPEVVRRYSVLECERLQTVPENYTNCVSNSQRYKMLGNGWTVDVIAHIFSFIPKV